MAGNPYNSPFTTTGTLSGYFEKEKAKGTKAGGVSPYSAPAEPTNGTAPSGGGRAAPSASSAPKSAAGGGTGFVSFGQYFGANAPAIQQQAQQVVQRQGGGLQSKTGDASIRPAGPMQFGAYTRQGPLPKMEQDPYAAQIAQTSAQFEALNPAAQYGDMGKDVSAFDQLLGGGVTQRAAKGEQQRLGTLRAALEGEQAQWQQQQQAAQAAKAKEAAYADWAANLPTQFRYNNTPEELRAMFEDEWKAGTYNEKTPGMVSTPGSSL